MSNAGRSLDRRGSVCRSSRALEDDGRLRLQRVDVAASRSISQIIALRQARKSRYGAYLRDQTARTRRTLVEDIRHEVRVTVRRSARCVREVPTHEHGAWSATAGPSPHPLWSPTRQAHCEPDDGIATPTETRAAREAHRATETVRSCTTSASRACRRNRATPSPDQRPSAGSKPHARPQGQLDPADASPSLSMLSISSGRTGLAAGQDPQRPCDDEWPDGPSMRAQRRRRRKRR